MIRKSPEMEVETRENMKGGQGKVAIQHFFKQAEFTSKTRLCSRLVLPAGASIGMHRHEKEDELFYVLKGTGILDDNGARTRISEGDAILTGGGDGHAVINDSRDDLELVAVIMCY